MSSHFYIRLLILVYHNISIREGHFSGDICANSRKEISGYLCANSRKNITGYPCANSRKDMK